MEQYLNNTDDIQALINILPSKIAEVINAYGNIEKLIEVVMDVGRMPLARYTSGDLLLSEEEISYEDIDGVVGKIGTFDLDNRAGMERTLHRISAIRNRHNRIIGLTCRVGRAVFGNDDHDHLAGNECLAHFFRGLSVDPDTAVFNKALQPET